VISASPVAPGPVAPRWCSSQRFGSCAGLVLKHDGGQALAEYAMVAGLFAIIMIAAMVVLGANAGKTLSTTQTKLGQIYASP
jgi:Flp pilus assembly pilin Flp